MEKSGLMPGLKLTFMNPPFVLNPELKEIADKLDKLSEANFKVANFLEGSIYAEIAKIIHEVAEIPQEHPNIPH